MHIIEIITTNKKTKNIIEIKTETFYSVYNAKRRLFEINDMHEEKNKFTHPDKTKTIATLIKNKVKKGN